MDEEKLMSALAQVATEVEKEERSKLDPRWDRLSDGTLSADDEAELRALAEKSDKGREAYEAFRPLDAAFRARAVRAVRDKALDSSQRAKVLPFRQRAARAARWLAPAAAAAAALVLVFTRPPSEELRPWPAYTVTTFDGAERKIRSEHSDSAAEVFVHGGFLTLTLTPATRVSEDVDLRCFLERGDELRVWEVAPEFSPSGSVKMRATIDSEFEPGEWTLWMVVGRRGKMPDIEELRPFVGPEEIRQRDWTLLKKAFRIDGDR